MKYNILLFFANLTFDVWQYFNKLERKEYHRKYNNNKTNKQYN